MEEEGLRKAPPFPQTILHKGNAPSPTVDLQEVLLSLPVIDATAVSLSLRGTVNELRGLQSIRMTASQESFSIPQGWDALELLLTHSLEPLFPLECWIEGAIDTYITGS